MAGSDKRQRKKENARLAREQREAALRRQRQRKTAIRVGIFVALFAIVVALFAVLGGDDDTKSASTSSTGPTTTTVAKVPKSATATITTNFGTIVVKLDTKNAPNGSARFIRLAKEGFYDGKTWERAARDFVIQGGSGGGPSSGVGSPIIGEIPKEYPLGAVAAAKGDNDPAGWFDSTFFIVTGEGRSGLQPLYASFGQVTAGMDVAEKIEALAPPEGDGPPTKKATIDKVSIEEKK